jgi:outer membrane receptor for ferrienterochelin and colicin
MERNDMRDSFRTKLILLVILVLAVPLAGQDITKGSIAGVVKDASGAVVPGVTVQLTSPYGDRQTTTNQLGSYVFANLVVGSGYALQVQQPGFNIARVENVIVRINQRTTVDLILEVGSAAQTVEVVAGGIAAIDLNTTTVGATLSEDLYKNVAIGRNISSVISMAPGVSDGLGAGAANPSINGASGLENMYVVNGANVTDPGFGGFGTFSRVFGSLGNGVNFDFIQEVQVKSGGFEAQYGQALGGIVNVITKSGTNEIHGSVYSYFQPHALEAERPDANLVNQTQHTRIVGAGSYDFGFDLGGYLKKDKLFWYGGFNPQFIRDYRSAPPVFGNSRLGTIAIKGRTLNYQGKINYNITERHQLEGSVFGDPSSRPTGYVRSTALASNDDLRTSGIDYGSRTWTVRYNGALTNSWIVSANFSNYFNSFTETPRYNGVQITDSIPTQEGTGSQIIRAGLGFLEGSEARTKQVALMSTNTIPLLGSHTVDYGYQFEDVPYDDIRLYTGGDIQIPDRPEFKDAAGQIMYGATVLRTHTNPKDLTSPIVLQVTRGNYSQPATSTLTRYHAAFVQDSWNIGNRLTIRPGLRWEQQRMEGNASHYSFTGNWAPRIGVIFDPTGSRRSKFFANWGRFFERVPSDISVRAFSFESGVRGAWYKDPGPDGAADLSPANYVGNILTGQKLAFSGGPNALTIVQPGTKSQYQEEAVGGFEQEFGQGWAFSGRFVYRHIQRIIEDVSPINVTQYLAGVAQQYVVANPDGRFDISVNGFPCTASDPNCDPDTGFNKDAGEMRPDGIPDGFPNPVRVYKAMELVLNRRMSNWQFFTSYRLSKLFGNFEGSFRNDNGQQDPNISSLFDFTNSDGLLADQFAPGVLPADRRHQFKLFANHQFTEKFLRNLNAGLSWNIQSGTPISKFLAHPGYDNSGEIPVGGRGSLGRTDWNFPVDLHLDYTVKLGEKRNLKFVADMFNVFNQKTVLRIDQNYELDSKTLNPDFLHPNTTDFAYPYQRPFYGRFAVRFEF